MEKFHKGFGALFGKRVEEEGADEGEDAGTKNDFETSWGWVFNAKRVADFENITMEATYGLGVIQFLNDLVYLKEFEADQLQRVKKDSRYGNTE